MATILNLQTWEDDRGKLTLLVNGFPFQMERLYVIYEVPSLETERAKHYHKLNAQLFVALRGSCEINLNGTKYLMDSPSKALYVNPEEWEEEWPRVITNFTPDCILLVAASKTYNPNDNYH